MERKLYKFLFILAFICITQANANVNLLAQDNNQKDTSLFTPFSVSAHLYLNNNLYFSSFKDLPGFDNCCTEFSGGFGIGPAIGIGGEYMFDTKFLSSNLRYSFKLLYSDQSGNYNIDEFIGYNINGNVAERIISTYTLEATLKTLTTEHLFSIEPFAMPLQIHGGFQVAFPLTAEIYQKEKKRYYLKSVKAYRTRK